MEAVPGVARVVKRTPLATRSTKRITQDRARVVALQEVRRRSGGRCEMADLVPEVRCGGPMDGDEVLPRAQGGDPTDPDQIVNCCRNHHDWKHAEPDEAHARGLRRFSYEGPRCSPEYPCDGYNTLHVMLWGECFHRGES